MPDSSYDARTDQPAQTSPGQSGPGRSGPGRSSPPPEKRSHVKLLIVGLVVLVLLLALAAYGILSRRHADANLTKETDEQAVPTVLVVRAQPGPDTEELVLPGNVQARFETQVYARTNGYLKKWYVDIGARVKAGQLLAEIETPEIDDQLRQAQADLSTAKANNQLAQITVKRWKNLLKTDSVSRQETDEKIGDAEAKAALVRASSANVARLANLEGFKRVLAPYDGVITARLTDYGALINAGGSGQELFRMADISKLRVYVQVPQTYAFAVKPGMIVQMRFAEHPGRTFPATLVRTSGALDPNARTLLVELQAANPDNQLLSGGYTEVHMKMPASNQTIRLPVSALLFRADGLSVVSVTNDQKAVLNKVTIGRDFGAEVEVLTGLKPGEPIVINPPDSIVSGEQLRVTQEARNQNGQGQNPAQPQTQSQPPADNAPQNGPGTPAAIDNQKQQMQIRTQTGDTQGAASNRDNSSTQSRQSSSGQ